MQLGFPRDIRCPVGFAVAEIDLKAGKFSKPRVLTASTLIRQSTSRSSKGFEIAQSRRQANGLHLLSKKPERFRSVARSDNTTPVFSRIHFRDPRIATTRMISEIRPPTTRATRHEKPDLLRFSRLARSIGTPTAAIQNACNKITRPKPWGSMRMWPDNKPARAVTPTKKPPIPITRSKGPALTIAIDQEMIANEVPKANTFAQALI
jgi:hypothetical protein